MLLVLVSFYFVVRYVNKFFNWLQVKLRDNESQWFRAVKISNYEVFTPGRALSATLLLTPTCCAG